MAGLGRKVFTRETLGSAELNGYLMDQAVMVFPSASARNTAIPAPAEGMVCYLGDVDSWFGYYSGGWHRFAESNTWSVIAQTDGTFDLPLPIGSFTDLVGATVTYPAGRGVEVFLRVPVLAIPDGGIAILQLQANGTVLDAAQYNSTVPGWLFGSYVSDGGPVVVKAVGQGQGAGGRVQSNNVGFVRIAAKAS